MDISNTIAPRSDQLNADDLTAGPITVTIEDVSRGNAEQPVNIHLQGFPGRPFKPGLSMRRVLVAVWGPDAKQYIGRSLTLYTDPEITFGKDKVGGVRISHMSHLDKAVAIPLTVTRGKRRPFRVEPLTQTAPTPTLAPQTIEDATTVDHLRALWGQATPEQQARIQQRVQELQEAADV